VATIQADESVLLTWDDAVGEAEYQYEFSFATAMIGSTVLDSLPADTTSYDGGVLACGGSGSFTLIALDSGGAEIGRATANFSSDPCPAETATLSPASKGQVDSAGDIRSPSNVGDTSHDRGLQGFITFDVSSIPDTTTIQSVKFKFASWDTLGDPFGSLGCLRVYVDSYGTLDAGDYTPPPVTGAIARFCSEADLGDPTEQELNASGVSGVQSALSSNQFQIRLQFDNRQTDNDGVADVFRSSSPRLEVAYQP
jgi:hypothetical protein